MMSRVLGLLLLLVMSSQVWAEVSHWHITGFIGLPGDSTQTLTLTPGASTKVLFSFNNGAQTLTGMSYVITDGTDSFVGSWSLSSASYSIYFYTGSSWDLISSSVSGVPSQAQVYIDIYNEYESWRAENAFQRTSITLSAFLAGYSPPGPESPDGPTDGPQAPPPGWDFDWPYAPGDNVPLSDMTLLDALNEGIVTPSQYAELLARGWSPSDIVHAYSEQGPNAGIILGRPQYPSGYNIHWEYNSGGAGWRSGGNQTYSPGETDWMASGPYQPPTQAPPSAPPPSNENPSGDITNDQNTATGVDELEELERLNDNVNNVADVVETSAQALLDQGEDTQDMMAAEAAAQAERDNIRDEELKEANRIARQQLNELQKMNAKMEEVREAVEDIETGGGGGTGGEVTVDGEIGEYQAFEGADSGLTTDAADGLASSIGAKVGPHTVDFSGPATSFSFSIPMPSGDPYAVVLPLVPETGTPLGDALDLFRIIVRLCLAMILFYIFSVSVIKTIRT